MPFQDRQLDFEDFSTDTEKISAILKRTEISSSKHKLCYEYYRARKLALLSPSVLSCLAIGIIGFSLSTDEVVKDHMQLNLKDNGANSSNGMNVPVEDILKLVVGSLGIFVGMSILLMNQWDFGGRESMHLSAYLQCDELGNKVRFWKMDRRVNDVHNNHHSSVSERNVLVSEGGRAVGVVKAPHSEKMAVVIASGKALRKVDKEMKKKTADATKMENKRDEVVRFAGYNMIHQQINLSCSSTIPNELSRPFDLFESRLECMSLGHLGVVWDTRMRRNQIMRLAAVEIYNEISAHWLWPFGIPDVERVLDRSMKRVARLISKDYREPIKVECCGFTIFRCCCRKANPKSSALHDIWDGMEDREQDLMEVRGIANYVDSGDRHFGSSPLDDEAYEAEQKLLRLEDGDYSQQSFRSQDRPYYPQLKESRHSFNDRVAPVPQRKKLTNSNNVKHVRRSAPGSVQRTRDFPLLTEGSIESSRYSRRDNANHSISDSHSRGTGQHVGSRGSDGSSSRILKAENSMSVAPSGSVGMGRQTGGSRISVDHSKAGSQGGRSAVQIAQSRDGSRSKSHLGWDEASESQYRN